jgi:hypothetical protein
VAQTEVRRTSLPPSGTGSEVALGGGMTSFTGGTAQGMAQSGASWDLRLIAGTRSITGIEAAYIGTAQKLQVSGLDPDASLIGNGVEGALRINVPVVTEDGLFEPFAFGGVGWTRFDVINDTYNHSAVKEKDNIMTVPVGAGLAMSYRGFMVDARYTYRFTYRDALLAGADMRNWIVSANIGREF